MPLNLVNLVKMSKSVSDRLKAFRSAHQEVQEQEERQDVEKMTLAELRQETISFGAAHKGKSFQTVFDHYQPWVDWFTSHYEKSTKVAHRKFSRFVELTLDEETKQGAYPKAKAMMNKPPTGKPSSPATSWTAVEVTSEDAELEESFGPAMALNLQEEMTYVREENRQLHGRLTQLEMSMFQILEQLQKMSIKEEK